MRDEVIGTLIKPPRVIYATPEPETARNGAKLTPKGYAESADLLGKRLRYARRQREDD